MCVYAENFGERWHLATIQDEGKIYTACGEGKFPFISAMDIAAVAFRALTDEKTHNTDYLLEGAELLSHDQVRCFSISRQHTESYSCRSPQNLVAF